MPVLDFKMPPLGVAKGGHRPPLEPKSVKYPVLNPIDNEIISVQKALDRKLDWLRKLDDTDWKDWPLEMLRIKIGRRDRNRILKLSKSALESGSIFILTEKEIPPEAIVVLAKRIGFVPTSNYNHLQKNMTI